MDRAGFSGLIMVEAVKQVYAVSGTKQKSRRLVPSLSPTYCRNRRAMPWICCREAILQPF
jgi:hypothetical protein